MGVGNSPASVPMKCDRLRPDSTVMAWVLSLVMVTSVSSGSEATTSSSNRPGMVTAHSSSLMVASSQTFT